MIRIEALAFAYPRGPFALAVPELRVERGSVCAVTGPSGTGKTTLLQLIAGIARPQAGRVVVDGTELGALGERQRRAFRIARVGLVFQEFELLDYLSVEDNLLLPYRLTDALGPPRAARARAAELAGRAGLGDLLGRPARRLSQGERQRVAVCRALVPAPPLLLADEPTGNLDPDNRDRMIGLVLDEARAAGTTVLAVVHDRELLPRFGRRIEVADGGVS